jgi:hypothetical protein
VCDVAEAEANGVTQTQGERLIAKWQQRCGLGEWTIRLLLIDAKTLTNGNWGEIHSNDELLEAVMLLPSRRLLREAEQTICHELVHLVNHEQCSLLESVCSGLNARHKTSILGLWATAEERLCNRLARALSNTTQISDPKQFCDEESPLPRGEE